jgi:PspA-Associated protein
VIVRISTEGQYELPDSELEALNRLDNEAVVACEATDEQQFREAFGRLLEEVRSRGQKVPDDELRGSDLILPPPDVSLEEARAEFSGDGLIPG